MVNKFPWEVKLCEFGLARDITRMISRRSYQWRNPQVKRHTHSYALFFCWQLSEDQADDVGIRVLAASTSLIIGMIIENSFEILFP